MGSYVGGINFDLRCYFYKARVMQITNKNIQFFKKSLNRSLDKKTVLDSVSICKHGNYKQVQQKVSRSHGLMTCSAQKTS